ncbi:beta strand repeat-containing protein [Nostoc sp.]|uniref:beta strand repeat-containing protein n=1 Tax=Nostoc sp. TaxID=1180 RepID=UPI002FFBC6B6
MADIIGTNGNDTLVGSNGADTIKGLAGSDTLTGGGGKDKFVYNLPDSYYGFITDFDGIGKGTNPTAGVIAKVDTIKFQGDSFKAQNLLLTQNGNNLEINFEGVLDYGLVILQDFALENLDNLSLSTGASVNLGNILFDGQTSITDSFDVFNANSTQSTIFNKNTVTFLNDLDNNVNGFDNSDDVINGQGGDDKINGLSGNDLLRDGAGNNTLNGGAGNDTLSFRGFTGNNLLSGEDDNDYIFLYNSSDIFSSSSSNNTLNGGPGDDTLRADYRDYSSLGDNLLSGGDGNDSLLISATGIFFPGDRSYDKNTLSGGAGDDTLSTSGLSGDNLFFGGDGNDSLSTFGAENSRAAEGNNTLNGGNGDDTLNGGNGIGNSNDYLTGGGGKDKFVYNLSYSPSTITDFGGVAKGTNPTSAVIAEVDTLIFQGAGLTAQNLLLTQNGNNLEISFVRVFNFRPVILQNFALENLDNLSLSTGTTVDLGNILFDGQTSITDSFDVFNANSTQSTIFNKNTVTFLNDLDNNVNGFDNSDDVINGQGGDDKIDGLSGNDLLRGGVGNNTLNGDTGNDTLDANSSPGNNLLSGGDGNDSLSASGYQYYDTYSKQDDDLRSSGNNTLNGGVGNDTLNASGSKGDNLLSGGDGNDSLSASGSKSSASTFYYYFSDSRSEGNNTLNGGAGDDYLSASGSSGDNLLSGGDGNDSLDVSGFFDSVTDSSSDSLTLGNNLLSGGDGNDSFYVSSQSPSYYVSTPSPYPPAASDFVTQTVDGGKGDNLLSVDYSDAEGGIVSTFNATTNIGEITAGTSRVNYKLIERLNILGTYYDDNIVGNSGNDTLSTGTSGKDTIDGGTGEDVLSVDYIYYGSQGITTTFNAATNIGEITAGTNSVNYKNIERLNISGTDYDDFIVGNSGNDTFSTGYSGNDTIDGGKGDDVLSVNYDYYPSDGITSTFDATTNIGSIIGSIAGDTNGVSYKNIERLNISGTVSDDLIVGSNGNDTLYGYAGNDSLYGGNGNDTLYGYSGNDSLYGGNGNDTFTFKYIDSIFDTIYDFNATNDLIQLSVDDFGSGVGLPIGSLKPSQFTLGTSATTSDQRFIYDNITGALYFDPDGSASAVTQVKFAQFLGGVTLTEKNFVVV